MGGSLRLRDGVFLDPEEAEVEVHPDNTDDSDCMREGEGEGERENECVRERIRTSYTVGYIA